MIFPTEEDKDRDERKGSCVETEGDGRGGGWWEAEETEEGYRQGNGELGKSRERERE